MSILLKILFVQIIAVSVIVFILKKILDGQLMDLALRQFEFSREKRDAALEQLVVISHKKLKQEIRDKINKITEKQWPRPVKVVYQTDGAILGGLIIRLGDQQMDFSLRDRLRQALNR